MSGVNHLALSPLRWCALDQSRNLDADGMVSLRTLPRPVIEECLGHASGLLSPAQRTELLDSPRLPFVVAQVRTLADSTQQTLELEQLILFTYLSLAIAAPNHSYPQFIFFLRFDRGHLEPVNPPIIGRDTWMTQWENYGSQGSRLVITTRVAENTAAYFQTLLTLRNGASGFSRILNATRFYWRALMTPETDWILGYAQLFTALEAIFEVDSKDAGHLKTQLLISPRLVWDPMEIERGAQRIRIPELVGRAWKLRSKVVHGDDPAKAGSSTENEATIRDLAFLVRKSVQCVLRDDTLLTQLDNYDSAKAAIRGMLAEQ